MIDCSDRNRLTETGNEFAELLVDEKLNDVPIMIFANKQDLENVLKVSEVAEAIGLVKLKDRTWQIQECSALEGTGIKVYKFMLLSNYDSTNDLNTYCSFVYRKEWTGCAKISRRIN